MATNNYVKLDAGFFFNPKIMPLSHELITAYICSICIAKMANQNGLFQVPLVRAATRTESTDFSPLFEAGFWVETETPNVAVIHDYLDWNQSREEIAERTEILRDNGRKGGRPRKGQGRKPRGETRPLNQDVKPDAETNLVLQVGKPSGLTNTLNQHVKPMSESLKEGRKEVSKELTPPADKSADPPKGVDSLPAVNTRETKKQSKPSSPKRGKKTRQEEIPLPDDWEPTEAHRAKCAELGISLDEAVTVFKDWAEDGKTMVRWNATFTTGLNGWIPQAILERHKARAAAHELQTLDATRPLPADWVPNGQGENLAVQAGITDVSGAVGVFRDWHLSRGTVSADWDAEWRRALKWLPDAVKPGGRRGDPVGELDRAAAEFDSFLQTKAGEDTARGTKQGHRGKNTPGDSLNYDKAASTAVLAHKDDNHNTYVFGEPPF